MVNGSVYKKHNKSIAIGNKYIEKDHCPKNTSRTRYKVYLQNNKHKMTQ